MTTQHHHGDSCEEDLIPTRKSLLGRLKDWRDKESWGDFFNTYWKLIYNFAVQRGLSHQEAVDGFLALDDPDPSITPDSVFFHAMALHQLGEIEKARETLADGNKRLEKYLELRITEKLPWQPLAVCEFARDEAEALIGKAPATVDGARTESDPTK